MFNYLLTEKLFGDHINPALNDMQTSVLKVIAWHAQDFRFHGMYWFCYKNNILRSSDGHLSQWELSSLVYQNSWISARAEDTFNYYNYCSSSFSLMKNIRPTIKDEVITVIIIMIISIVIKPIYFCTNDFINVYFRYIEINHTVSEITISTE